MLVLVRRLSTKASREPLSTVSLLGELMERFSSVPTKRDSTADSPGKNIRHHPATRSKAASSSVVRSAAERLYSAPPIISSMACRGVPQRASASSWASGRST